MEKQDIVIVANFGSSSDVEPGHGIGEFVFLSLLLYKLKVKFCKRKSPSGEMVQMLSDVHQQM